MGGFAVRGAERRELSLLVKSQVETPVSNFPIDSLSNFEADEGVEPSLLVSPAEWALWASEVQSGILSSV